MISLRNYIDDDAELFQKYSYKNMTIEDIKKLFAEWNSKVYQGRYFEMFAILNGQEIIGSISLYQHSANVISYGLEIFDCYRKQGFGRQAMNIAFDIAKTKGYKIVLQQIRIDNRASVALHHSLGFETDGYAYRNKKGNEVSIYLKLLV